MDSRTGSTENGNQRKCFGLDLLERKNEREFFFSLYFQWKNAINKDGYFVVKSDLTRYQHMNLADALEKVRNIIRNLEKESVVKVVSPERKEEFRRR